MRQEEALQKRKKDLEKTAAKAKASSASSANGREAELQEEVEKCMVCARFR